MNKKIFICTVFVLISSFNNFLHLYYFHNFEQDVSQEGIKKIPVNFYFKNKNGRSPFFLVFYKLDGI
ncbi:hypothetical protein QIA45_05145 (plasmid) [Borreliella andersonii]|uniref:Uncharacterized protein n=1 Tax=Borrelia andersonii TaxID=42109 RepID=A0ACD5G651_BORAD